jgi:glycosyltransferase involved in cell wall biosynthesis
MTAELRLPVSVCLIAGNEAHRIRRTLDSVQGWTKEIIVAIDDRVTDGTDKIAESYGARIVSQPWRGHAAHRNFASTHATQPWLLAIDADEVIPPSLRDEIIRLFEQHQSNPPCAAYRFPRCTFYHGRWIRHGDWYPDRKARLWRRGSADWGDKRLHESLVVNGPTGDLTNDLRHYSMESLEHEMKKTMLSVDYFAQECAEQKRRIYFTAVLFHPWWRFFRSYFLRLGFLDGWQGLAIARIIALYTFLRYLKVYQLQNEKKPVE